MTTLYFLMCHSLADRVHMLWALVRGGVFVHNLNYIFVFVSVFTTSPSCAPAVVPTAQGPHTVSEVETAAQGKKKKKNSPKYLSFLNNIFSFR